MRYNKILTWVSIPSVRRIPPLYGKKDVWLLYMHDIKKPHGFLIWCIIIIRAWETHHYYRSFSSYYEIKFNILFGITYLRYFVFRRPFFTSCIHVAGSIWASNVPDFVHQQFERAPIARVRGVPEGGGGAEGHPVSPLDADLGWELVLFSVIVVTVVKWCIIWY